jgi:hypothetical protein
VDRLFDGRDAFGVLSWLRAGVLLKEPASVAEFGPLQLFQSRPAFQADLLPGTGDIHEPLENLAERGGFVPLTPLLRSQLIHSTIGQNR